MVAPLLMYGAPAAAAAITGIWWFSRKKASGPTSQPATPAADPTAAATTAGYDYGCIRGKNDALTGGVPIADLSADADMASAAATTTDANAFIAAATDGYATCYAANVSTAVTTDSTPAPTGGTKGDAVKSAVASATKVAAKAAWLEGCTRGSYYGWKDAANDYANNPTPSGSKFSSASANAAYQYAYRNSYNVTYAVRKPMTGLPGYDVGEQTEIPTDQQTSAINGCNSSSNFETWYTSKGSVAGVAGFSVGGVTQTTEAVVGTVVSGASDLVNGVQSMVKGVLETSVAGYKIGDAAHVAGGGLSGFMVAGIPGAVIGTCTTGAMQHDRVRKMGRVLPTAVAAVAGFVVAGIPGAVAGTLAVVGAHMRHVTNKPHALGSATIARMTSDVKSGKLTPARAEMLANALDTRGDKHAATAVRASIAGLASAGVGATHKMNKPHKPNRRHPMMRRSTAG